mgnify:CR=1 FL=1
MNRSASSDRMAGKATPRARAFAGDDRAKYPSYIQIVLGIVVLGFIFGKWSCLCSRLARVKWLYFGSYHQLCPR